MGRQRFVPNKIKQNELRQSITSSTQPSNSQVNQAYAVPKNDPQPVSSPGPSNIESSKIIKNTRYKESNKVLNKKDPGSLIMTGMGNTISDYGGIVDGNYKTSQYSISQWARP